MNKIITSIILTLIVAGGGGFYGGMVYGKGKTANQSLRFQGAGEGRMLVGDGSGQFRTARNGGQAGGGFVAGEVIAKDGESVTVKLPDGGSKIVFFSDSTEVSKFTGGSADDLKAGENIMVTGTANSDGSVSAKTIQLRPEMPVIQSR